MYRVGFVLLGTLLLVGCAAPAPSRLADDPAFGRMLAGQEQLLGRLRQLEGKIAALEDRLESVAAEPGDARQSAPEAEAPPEVISLTEPSPEDRESQAELFRDAFSHYAYRRFAEAARVFESFISRYPEHEHLSAARFLLAESLYGAGRYEAAAAQYLRLTEDAPLDARVPQALKGLAMTYEAQGNLSAAREVYEALEQQYPERPRPTESNIPTGGKP